MVKVHIMGRKGEEQREVSFEEAERLVKETYEDPLGGLVADAKTKEIIWEMRPDIEEIVILGEIIGGG
jgi:hypothetical protein